MTTWLSFARAIVAVDDLVELFRIEGAIKRGQ
jgi:hypothetical protein